MKPLVIFPLLGAFVLTAVVVRGLRKGQIRFKAWLDIRSRDPISYWASILLYSLTALAFLVIAAKQVFFPN